MERIVIHKQCREIRNTSMTSYDHLGGIFAAGVKQLFDEARRNGQKIEIRFQEDERS